MIVSKSQRELINKCDLKISQPSDGSLIDVDSGMVARDIEDPELVLAGYGNFRGQSWQLVSKKNDSGYDELALSPNLGDIFLLLCVISKLYGSGLESDLRNANEKVEIDSDSLSKADYFSKPMLSEGDYIYRAKLGFKELGARHTDVIINGNSECVLGGMVDPDSPYVMYVERTNSETYDVYYYDRGAKLLSARIFSEAVLYFFLLNGQIQLV